MQLRRDRRKRSLLAAALLALTTSQAAIGAAEPPIENGFQPATTCKPCHASIYEEWSTSYMARATENANFQLDLQQLRQLESRDGARLTRRCFSCHAPMALLTGDPSAASPLAREGVTCDFCHRVAHVAPGSQRYKPRLVANGPRAGTHAVGGSASHFVNESPAFADSSLCAICHHELLTPEIALERTYDEWRNGPAAAAGIGCAACHMPPAVGPAARDPGASSAPRTSQSHASHRFPGGHAASPLLRGAARIAYAAVSGPRRLEVRVRNGIGHSFPTAGAHPNRLELSVDFEDDAGNPLGRSSALFHYEYRNREGLPAAESEPVASVSDTTLAAGEERRVELAFPPKGDVTKVSVRLVYELIPGSRRALLAPDDADAYEPVVIDSLRRELDAPPDGAWGGRPPHLAEPDRPLRRPAPPPPRRAQQTGDEHQEEPDSAAERRR